MAKWSALAALVVAVGWTFISPDGWRLYGMSLLFPLVLLAALRLSGAVTRIAPWALCLLIAAVGASTSGLFCYGAATSLSDSYDREYVVLPEGPLPLALMSFLWLPALLLVLRRKAVVFEHDGVWRDVVPFVFAVGLLFSLAHPLVLLLGNAIGGYHGHVRTLQSADGHFRAELYKGHWLGEARYHLYLTRPSPAPMFGQRLDFEGNLETATVADLRVLPDGAHLAVHADGVLTGALDLATWRTVSRYSLRDLSLDGSRPARPAGRGRRAVPATGASASAAPATADAP